MYDGSIATFEAASRADAVSIIPIIDDKIVIIHEEQPTRSATIGFPGGHIEPGEDPLTAAKRELYEETGMSFKDLKLIAIEDIGGHKVDWNCYRYIATGLISRDEPRLDPGEKIVVEIIDFNKAKELAADNIYMAHMVMDDVKSVDDLIDIPAIELPENSNNVAKH